MIGEAVDVWDELLGDIPGFYRRAREQAKNRSTSSPLSISSLCCLYSSPSPPKTESAGLTINFVGNQASI